ncbi:2'-5' RNA ligase [Candidatus Rhodobacter oscarellae]|uniref:RNA 2',3'-cyclic phosphodiesterase n=1 Tax=Candidatus Rhodobacter oscarellae TaxID=1675527 RepID=A0A0J9E892_9RHOB|nr:RNA 2',3'-cyclic phosphodiesterase [Candidatus Rhodobacter lobularis]KMW58947.1 2'-5' RNA ligase [Candidatus Rhodobacter lobularis]
MIRAFVAIPLPEEARDQLEDAQIGLRVGRHVPSENFHITLAYLDKQTEQTLARVDEVLGQIDLPGFYVSIKGVDVFGGAKPRLLWAGVEPNDALSTLRERVRRAAMRSGVELSRERFRPHVTLARFKESRRGSEIANVQEFLTSQAGLCLPPFRATEFRLYRSTLHQNGATYDPLVSYGLT